MKIFQKKRVTMSKVSILLYDIDFVRVVIKNSMNLGKNI